MLLKLNRLGLTLLALESGETQLEASDALGET